MQLGRDEVVAYANYLDFWREMKDAFEINDVICVRAQPELAPSGQYHIQGYLAMPGRRAMTTMRNWFARTFTMQGAPHLEVPRGTPEQNEEYCIGDGPEGFCWPDMAEQCVFGDLPEHKQPGKRTDLVEAKAAIEGGVTESEFAAAFFGVWTRHPKLYWSYRNLLGMDQRDPNEDSTVIVLWGKTGVGKTREAWRLVNEMKEPYYWRKGVTGEFFSGYKGEKLAVLEEFDPEKIGINTLKDWLDRYPAQVAGKLEAYRSLAVNVWVITTQKEPSTWYPNAHGADRMAIFRRITKIKEVIGEDGKEAKDLDYDQEIKDMLFERTVTRIVKQEPEALPRKYQYQEHLQSDLELLAEIANNEEDDVRLSQAGSQQSPIEIAD